MSSEDADPTNRRRPREETGLQEQAEAFFAKRQETTRALISQAIDSDRWYFDINRVLEDASHHATMAIIVNDIGYALVECVARGLPSQFDHVLSMYIKILKKRHATDTVGYFIPGLIAECERDALRAIFSESNKLGNLSEIFNLIVEGGKFPLALAMIDAGFNGSAYHGERLASSIQRGLFHGDRRRGTTHVPSAEFVRMLCRTRAPIPDLFAKSIISACVREYANLGVEYDELESIFVYATENADFKSPDDDPEQHLVRALAQFPRLWMDYASSPRFASVFHPFTFRIGERFLQQAMDFLAMPELPNSLVKRDIEERTDAMITCMCDLWKFLMSVDQFQVHCWRDVVEPGAFLRVILWLTDFDRLRKDRVVRLGVQYMLCIGATPSSEWYVSYMREHKNHREKLQQAIVAAFNEIENTRVQELDMGMRVPRGREPRNRMQELGRRFDSDILYRNVADFLRYRPVRPRPPPPPVPMAEEEDEDARILREMHEFHNA